MAGHTNRRHGDKVQGSPSCHTNRYWLPTVKIGDMHNEGIRTWKSGLGYLSSLHHLAISAVRRRLHHVRRRLAGRPVAVKVGSWECNYARIRK
jgi:hypothetical protein